MSDPERQKCLDVGEQVGWDVMAAIKHLVEVAKDEKGRPLIKPSRFETIKKKYAPYKEIYLQNSRNERLANFYYEKRTLGYSFSESLRDIFAEHVDGLMTVAEAKKLPPKSKCRLIGFVKEKPYTSTTKAGNKKLKIWLADDTGEMSVLIFNDMIGLIKEQNGRDADEQDLVIINCKKMDGDVCFGDYGVDGVCVGLQSAKIYCKLSELGKERKKAEAAEEPAAQ